MLSGGEFIERLNERAAGARFSYRFPITHISLAAPEFSGNYEEDEETLAHMLELSIAELRSLSTRLFIRFNLHREGEAELQRPDRGHSWSRLLWNLNTDSAARAALKPSVQPGVVHFYGYKGGQARSTVLGFFGKMLAGSGWRVLAVDVDAEAPTLDVLLDVKAPEPSGTLVGLRAGLPPTPFRAATPPGDGFLDLLAFRPRDEGFDLDAAALAMEMAIAPPFTEDLIRQVSALRETYDLILVDHRTGLAATVPPWVQELPGPVVIFSRMDGQWEGALPHIEALWSLNPERPGVLVTFKSDDSNLLKYARRTQPQASVLLERLANVINSGAVADSEPATGDDLVDHWVIWSYDPAFVQGALPGPDDISAQTRESVEDLKRLLGLRAPRKHAQVASLHPSGALDEGDLIVTQALRELDTENATKWFILGRKGTGKTRLMRELADRGRGEPLIIAEKDEKASGIPARHPALDGLWRRHANAPQDFWWALLWAALSHGTQRDALVRALEEPMPATPRDEVIKLAAGTTHRRVFLIDGLETAFDRQDTHSAIGALFQVWSTLDVDSRLSSRIRMRIFLRTDLAQRGYENLEQILYDRKLDLAWDTQSILNFALSRIRARPWYRTRFGTALERIDKEMDKIKEGQLSATKCEEHLLEIFPDRLSRQNMRTETFLRTWFSDDPTGQSGYFPRIYDKFLEQISVEGGAAEEAIVDGRISQKRVLAAHEEATADFLQQVKVELYNLVDLEASMVDRLLAAFRERVTPFAVATEVEALAKETNLDPAAIRQALEQMKTLGIFEDRPGHAGQWRAGRLSKTSLGMRYKLGRRTS